MIFLLLFIPLFPFDYFPSVLFYSVWNSWTTLVIWSHCNKSSYLSVEAQRDFHKIQGNLKVVTIPTPTTAPISNNGSGVTMGGRQTSSADDDPRHHLFTVVVPRKTFRPQETNPSDGRFHVTSDTTSSTNTITWSTSTGTRYSTASGPLTTEMMMRPTIPASKK